MKQETKSNFHTITYSEIEKEKLNYVVKTQDFSKGFIDVLKEKFNLTGNCTPTRIHSSYFDNHFQMTLTLAFDNSIVAISWPVSQNVDINIFEGGGKK